MFHYLNVHSNQKLVNDCAKRSITLLTGKSYQEISLSLNRLKKETKSKKFNSNKNWKKFVSLQGWEKMSFPAESGKERMNGTRFCIAYPKGRYLLRMARHLTAVIDGVIYDTWNCSNKCVYNAWKIK